MFYQQLKSSTFRWSPRYKQIRTQQGKKGSSRKPFNDALSGDK